MIENVLVKLIARLSIPAMILAVSGARFLSFRRARRG